MEPEYSENPGKKVYTFQTKKDGPSIIIRSNFDSGNIGKLELGLNGAVLISPANDCTGSEIESHAKGWFHFAVQGAPVGSRLKFVIKRMNQLGTQVIVHELRANFQIIFDLFISILMDHGRGYNKQ